MAHELEDQKAKGKENFIFSSFFVVFFQASFLSSSGEIAKYEATLSRMDPKMEEISKTEEKREHFLPPSASPPPPFSPLLLATFWPSFLGNYIFFVDADI